MFVKIYRDRLWLCLHSGVTDSDKCLLPSRASEAPLVGPSQPNMSHDSLHFRDKLVMTANNEAKTSRELCFNCKNI